MVNAILKKLKIDTLKMYINTKYFEYEVDRIQYWERRVEETIAELQSSTYGMSKEEVDKIVAEVVLECENECRRIFQ